MVASSSSGKAQNMAASEEVIKYFSDLIKPLARNQSLEEIFSKLKEKIMSKFEERLEEQKKSIDERWTEIGESEQSHKPAWKPICFTEELSKSARN